MEKKQVLILVVMEYTQWVIENMIKAGAKSVLILVVMEYTQWEWKQSHLCVAFQS